MPAYTGGFRIASSAATIVITFDTAATHALLSRYAIDARVVLDVRELAVQLNSSPILAILESHFRPSAHGQELWYRSRATLLENNATDTQNLAFFTEQLVRYAQGE